MNHVAKVFRFGWTYLRKYWPRLAAGILFGVIFGLANASFVWATRTLTQRFGAEQATPTVAASTAWPLKEKVNDWGTRAQEAIDPWLPRVNRPLDWRQMLGGLLFLPLFVSIRTISDYLSNYCMGWVSERSIRDLRLDIMAKLSTLSLDFFNRSTTGDLLTRINVDSANLLRALRVGGADLIKESITLICVFLALCWLDWKLTLAAMVLLPLCLFPLIVLGKKARRASKASLNANILQSSQLVELLGSIRVVKAYNLEAEQLARFRKTSGDLVHAGMKGVQAKEMVNPIIEVISVIGLSALILYIFQSGRSGADLVAFLTGLTLFFLPIKKLAAVHILFEQASVGVMRLIEILQEEPKVREAARPKALPPFQSAVSFDRVGFAYGEKEVLRDFTFTLARGFKLGVAGESGSGKTTLVNLLFRFYDPSRGAIQFDGIDLRETSLHDLRQQLALVSQDVVLFDQTVAENIACGRPGATRTEVEAAARAAFAHEFILQMPQGYDTRVGERGVTLSGGQRQRIAIARAFVRNAPILVLDEATAALDSKAEGEVQAAIDRLAEHRTVVCVAHRLSTLASMDGIIVLTEGRLVEQGGFQELLRSGGAFAAMAARQGIFPAAAMAGQR